MKTPSHPLFVLEIANNHIGPVFSASVLLAQVTDVGRDSARQFPGTRLPTAHNSAESGSPAWTTWC